MDTNLPKVSIVLPTYNGAKYIGQSIDSCLNQTYKNIELIIVDDCSIDGTPEIIKSYNDARIKYIRHQENQRLPVALNTGFANSTGEYLTWTSDDNIYRKEAIEKMSAFLISRGGDFVFCNYYSFKEENINQLEPIRLPEHATFEKINPVRACFLYSRKVMEETGDYDPEVELAEDYDYWIRVSQKFPLHHLGEHLYYYRVHGEALYCSRFWEVEVVKFLVRLKYDISNILSVKESLLELFARKRRLFFVFNRSLYRLIFSNRMSNILSQFKLGQISFTEAKLRLTSIMNRAT